MKNVRFPLGLALVALTAGILAGCGGEEKVDPNDPSTIENSSKVEPKMGGPGLDSGPTDKPQ